MGCFCDRVILGAVDGATGRTITDRGAAGGRGAGCRCGFVVVTVSTGDATNDPVTVGGVRTGGPALARMERIWASIALISACDLFISAPLITMPTCDLLSHSLLSSGLLSNSWLNIWLLKIDYRIS
jgi:hypothetical protein